MTHLDSNCYTYQQERFATVWPELHPMLVANHAETDLFGHPLEVDAEGYTEMDEAGSYRPYTLRRNGELVGYCGFVLYSHPHHVSKVHACQDALYVRKSHRSKVLRFIAYCDSKLREAGVNVVIQHCPTRNDWSPVLKRLGYEALETSYFRRLIP